MDKKVLTTVIDHISEQHKERTAVQGLGQTVSYAALRQAYDGVAALLLDAGLRRGQVVGVYMDACAAYISAIIGTNKAGGLFLPLSSLYPQKRLKRVIEKAGPEIFITLAPARDGLLEILLQDEPRRPFLLILADAGLSGWTLEKYDGYACTGRQEARPHRNRAYPAIEGHDGNYLIYTSGTTGEPKMIEGQHKSLGHFINWEMNEFQCNEHTKVSFLAPVSFDVSFRDIFLPLSVGGTVCIPPADIKLHPGRWLKWLSEAGITLMHVVPSLFRTLIARMEDVPEDRQYLHSLKHILLAGEVLMSDDVSSWTKLDPRAMTGLANLYGPSETTLAKVFNRIDPGATYPPGIVMPLGVPISNTSVLILNQADQLCNIGEIGEICIRTPFMSKGYFGNPELTKQFFVQNPLHGDFADVIYRTGDMGRYLEDGKIGFSGRKDSQVKIRGNRVEIQEVELMIRQYDGIKQAVVVPVARKNVDTALACYYIEKEGYKEKGLKAHLQECLPDYMVPSYFIALESFPLNINGKLDKNALPPPEDILYDSLDFKEPSTAAETAIAAIWQEVLGLKRVGVQNSFFEVGGHSLSATKIISLIYKRLERQVTLKEFFHHPTVEGLASLVDGKANGVYHPIEPVEQKDLYDVSQAQKRLWILHQTQKAGMAYNIPLAGTVHKHVDADALKSSFAAIVARHESLRTTFVFASGELKQRIHGPSFVSIREIEEQEGHDQPVIDKHLDRITNHVFDLEKGPLFTVDIIRLPSHRRLLLLNMHHIIGDGWSTGVLIRELGAFYEAFFHGNAYPLTPLRIQYKDYVAWHGQLLRNQAAAHQNYWQQELAGDIPVINLPYDLFRPAQQSYRGRKHRFVLSGQLSDFLRKTAQEEDASLFAVMLSVIYTLLYNYSGQQDILVGTPVSGRDHENLHEQVGFYLNYLVLRMQVQGKQSFSRLIHAVSRKVVDAMAHSLYPYDQLVSELAAEHPDNRNPFYDVLVVMNNPDLNGSRKDFDRLESSLGLEGLNIEDNISKLDLSFFISDLANIGLTIEYSTDLFLEATIVKMEKDLLLLAETLLKQPHASIDELTGALTDEQEMQLWKDNLDVMDETF